MVACAPVRLIFAHGHAAIDELVGGDLDVLGVGGEPVADDAREVAPRIRVLVEQRDLLRFHVLRDRGRHRARDVVGGGAELEDMLHLVLGDLLTDLERRRTAGDHRGRGLLELVHHPDEHVAGEKAHPHVDLVDGEGARDHVEPDVALALVVVPDDADLHRLAADLDRPHALQRDLRAGLHLRAHVGADPGDGQERAELDFILGARDQGGREERGQAERERHESDRRGFAHGHASAWWIVPGRTVAG